MAKDLPADRLFQPVTTKWFVVVFGTSLAYAILRYHLAGDVAWSHFPLYILNKATSLAAVAFIASSYLIGRVFTWHNKSPQKLVIIKYCGLMGLSLAGMHVFFSVCLLNPAYFAKYFGADGRLNWMGELGLAFGVVGLWALCRPAITTAPNMAKELGGVRWKRTQRMGYISLMLTLGHLVVFGFKGWLAPQTWPTGLPPISLFAALIALVPIVAKLRR
jgi:DMSO/TMAO reductase YedYZ heme-binding membrane subunit